MKYLFPERWRVLAGAVLAALLLAAMGFLAWQRWYPATPGPGWEVRTYLDNVPMVSALASDGQGALFILLEHNHRQGKLIRRLAQGETTDILTGLDRPDGLAPFHGGVLLSQEGGEYPVLWWKNGHVEELFKGRSIEGVDSDDRSVYAIEDVKADGRLLRFDRTTSEIKVLRRGLREAEGVTVCPDGRLYYSEKKNGWIKLYRGDAVQDELVLDRLRAPGFIKCDAGGLWIAEDATHRARLLYRGNDGKTQVVLSHLRSAQAVLRLASGRLLVAEQGRSRILEIRRTGHGNL